MDIARRLIAALLVVLLSLGSAACGEDGGSGDDGGAGAEEGGAQGDDNGY